MHPASGDTKQVFGWSPKNVGNFISKLAGYIPGLGSVIAVVRAIGFVSDKVEHSPKVRNQTITRCVLEAIPVVNTIALPIADLVATVRHYNAERAVAKLKLTGEDIVAPGWEKLRQKNYEEAIALFESALARYKKGDPEWDLAYLGLGEIYMTGDLQHINLSRAKACFLAVQNKKKAVKELHRLSKVCDEKEQSCLGIECDLAATRLSHAE